MKTQRETEQRSGKLQEKGHGRLDSSSLIKLLTEK
jgi:hypothetical protein